ncbi:response regulator [Bacterioplanoides sp.]|uniref:response regulator n=1 Tax=Bacterioplanoides sp. TaxID=2066072 RepID=UPI003B0096C5
MFYKKRRWASHLGKATRYPQRGTRYLQRATGSLKKIPRLQPAEGENTFLFHILAAMPGAWLLLDDEHRLVAHNPQALTMLGVSSLSDRAMQYHFPALNLKQLLTDSVPSSTQHLSVARAAGNNLFPVDVALQRFSHRNQHFVLLHFYNVSEREADTDVLKMEHAVHSTIIDNNVNAIVLINQDDEVEEFNIAACQMFGYLREEVIGQSLADLIIPPEARAFHRAGLKNYQKNGSGSFINRRVEVTAQHRSGEKFPVELTLFPLHISGLTYFSASLQDISERKQYVEALSEARDMAERANQYKSQFVASMSHEIRTPLNAVLGLLGLLQETELDTTQRHYVDTALNSGQGLLAILNDVLDFSKIEAGKLVLEQDDFNLANLMYDMVDLLSSRAVEKGIILSCYVDPAIPASLSGDSGRIRQVLMNLVGNAVKFTEQGEVIARVDLQQHQSDQVVLAFSVEDSGIGIAEDDQKKLFDEFIQADGNDSRRFGGTGLGLSISRKLLTLMNSEMSLRSRPGKGSTFSFVLSLPVASMEMAATAVEVTGGNTSDSSLQASHQNPHQSPLSRLEIGTWFDRDKSSLLLKEQLMSQGAATHTIECLEDCAELIADDDIDLIIIEFRALTQSAEAVLAQLRSLSADIPCVLLLEGNNQALIQHYQGVGFNLCLPAHYRPQWLASALTSLLNQQAPESFDIASELMRLPPEGVSFRILLAEDSQANQLVAINMLEASGYSVDAVANGLEAVRAVQNLPYDLVLMDLQMPEMDGLEATRQIRKLPGKMGQTPIIAMTANVIAEVKEQCTDAGMQGFVAKPVVKRDLLAELIGWVEAKQNKSTVEATPKAMPETTQKTTPKAEPVQEQVGLLDDLVLQRLIDDTSVTVVQRMASVFCDESQVRLQGMYQALAEHDQVAMNREAHTLKSSAASYGAMSLSQLAKTLEAKTKTEMASEAELKQLDDLIQLSIKALSQHPLLTTPEI